MAGETRILHVADSRLQERRGVDADAEAAPAGGLDDVVERAVDLSVDAVVHAGNLMAPTDPPERLVAAVRNRLDALHAEGIRLCYVAGRRDRAGQSDPWEDLADHPAAVHLGRAPTDVGSLALFGIDHCSAAELDAILDAGEFTPAAGVDGQLLAAPLPVSPPIDREQAVTQAFELASSVDLYLDAVLGGGTRRPRTWEHDDTDFGVYYPGTTSPRWADDAADRPRGVLFTCEAGSGRIEREVVALDPATPESELATLRELLAAHEPADLADADRETLVDLYGLLAQARSRLDDRRTEVRDRLLERTAEGETASGDLATVRHRHSTSRSLRDEETVREALRSAGVDLEEVTETVERIDEDAVDRVVEEEPVDPEAVYEETVRKSIRKREVSLED